MACGRGGGRGGTPTVNSLATVCPCTESRLSILSEHPLGCWECVPVRFRAFLPLLPTILLETRAYRETRTRHVSTPKHARAHSVVLSVSISIRLIPHGDPGLAPVYLKHARPHWKLLTRTPQLKNPTSSCFIQRMRFSSGISVLSSC